METILRKAEYRTNLSLSETMSRRRDLFVCDYEIGQMIGRKDIESLVAIDQKDLTRNIGTILFYLPHDFYQDTRYQGISKELAKTKIADNLVFASGLLDNENRDKAIKNNYMLERNLYNCVIPNQKIEILANTDNDGLFSESHEKIIMTLLVSNRISQQNRNRIFEMLDPEEQQCLRDEIAWRQKINIDQLNYEIEIGKSELMEDGFDYLDFFRNGLFN